MQKPLLSFQEEKLHAPEISIEEKLNGRCKKEEEGGGNLDQWIGGKVWEHFDASQFSTKKATLLFSNLLHFTLFFVSQTYARIGSRRRRRTYWRRLQSLFVHAMTTLAQVGMEIAIFWGFFKPFLQFPTDAHKIIIIFFWILWVIGECRVLDVWACAYATTTSTSAIDIQKKGRGGGGGEEPRFLSLINNLLFFSFPPSSPLSCLAGDADILRTHEVFPAVFVWETSESACTFFVVE